ncbi:hypothetical protein CALCODRAFT_504220 [Calocera cornea HHB12733]|uniref:Uncharacterized protein n=1 Tax=Calocera cornea HHB12733 TaxID=1353952 RepID=A0A165CJ36_9BASI|nr:hypothetical protein CALCODRAFT_504220 [Calocera cornea HHB12733]
MHIRPRTRLRRPTCLARPPRVLCARQYATADTTTTTTTAASPSPYHPKVTARPFTVSPAEAATAFEQYIDPRGWLQYVRPYSDDQLWNSYTVWTGLSAYRWEMVKMRPMYVPMWRVLTGVELLFEQVGEVSNPGTGEDRPGREVACMTGLMHGHAHHPLRTCWLSEGYHKDFPFAQFSPSMLTTPWGEHVGAIPYTVSPLKLLDNLAGDAGVERPYMMLGMTVLPGAKVVQPRFSPLVVPVYLAEFARKHDSIRSTLVLPAWVDDPTGKHPAESSYAPYVYGPQFKQDPEAGLAPYRSAMKDKLAWAISLYHLYPQYSPKRLATHIKLNLYTGHYMRWGEVGGVDNDMWEDTRILSALSTKWGDRRKVVYDEIQSHPGHP